MGAVPRLVDEIMLGDVVVIAEDDLVEALVTDQDNLAELFDDEFLEDEDVVENLVLLRDMIRLTN